MCIHKKLLHETVSPLVSQRQLTLFCLIRNVKNVVGSAVVSFIHAFMQESLDPVPRWIVS